MTVIYGDNGSGKSGYARLIKSFVKARHDSQILPDVFDANAPAPAAELHFTIAGAEATLKHPGIPSVESSKMTFYDEHCGDEYLNKQSTISYRPSVLTLLDGLIATCDEVRAELRRRETSNASSKLELNLLPQTAAGVFVLSLSHATTEIQIDNAIKLEPASNERLAEQLKEEARLLGSDPTKEQARLRAVVKDLTSLHTSLTAALSRLGNEAIAQYIQLRKKAADLRAAANVAATKSFDTEPLAGIGATSWRALWEAARQYSTTYPYHDHEFPVLGDDARCVLCQQPLRDDAKDRLKRFDSYMQDTTEREATTAEHAVTAALQALQTLSINSSSIASYLITLGGEDEQLQTAVQTLLTTLDQRRTAVVHLLSGGTPAPENLPEINVPSKIAKLIQTLQLRADQTDVAQFQTILASVTKAKQELDARIRLSKAKPALVGEVERLKKARALAAARSAADTSAITQKSSALTRKYATQEILDRFTRETERLNLERVTLQDLGGQKGQIAQQPGLLGAKTKAASARTVLSEGEQTALGLAGFFTEAVFDQSKSAIVFDDPVTSLDHVRRDKVAERLAQLAKERQVIVFTHDVAFTGDLAFAADSVGISLTPRAIERQGSSPGLVIDSFPWKAKDFNDRVQHMTQQLAKLKTERVTLSSSEYEVRVAIWAGDLSETWERAAISEIMNQVFDRGTSQVRVLKFRLLAQISEQDNQDYHEGYAHTSKWAKRHDKAPATNYVAPEPADLEAELERLKAWQKRVKKYI